MLAGDILPYIKQIDALLYRRKAFLRPNLLISTP